jgi:protein-S-isoprenylcysteine O-methyltransferase Ste14
LNTKALIADEDREHPRGHLIQLLCALAFFSVWFFDSYILYFSIELSSYIPLPIRIVPFILVLIIGITFVQLATKILFHNEHGERNEEHGHHHPDKIIDSGILTYVRNPMYLGVLLFYLAFVLVTLSIASLMTWIVIFTTYNRLATYEEKQLEKMFGEDYLKYKKRVFKWLPRF